MSFRRAGEGIEGRFGPGERHLLIALITDVRTLLVDPPPGPPPAPGAQGGAPAEGPPAGEPPAASAPSTDPAATDARSNHPASGRTHPPGSPPAGVSGQEVGGRRYYDPPPAHVRRTGDNPLAELLRQEPTDPGRPIDPALGRLFPDAYRDDEGASAEFRRLTATDLRAQKRADATTVLADLDAADRRLVITEDRAEVWLRVLNDLRLVLGSRLGLTTDDDTAAIGRVPADDPRAAVVDLYDYLTQTQFDLLMAVTGMTERDLHGMA